MGNLPETFFKQLCIASVIAALTALTVSVASADFSGKSWKYLKPLLFSDEITNEELGEVVPDMEVFAHSLDELSDLRIIESRSDKEVPYKLVVDRGEQRRRSVSVDMRDLGSVMGQYTSFILDLGGEGILHNEMQIQTPSQNFQRQVVVEGSEDAELWAILEQDDQIFDFSIPGTSFTTRNTKLKYPSAAVRYLRVRIVDEDNPALKITGAHVFFEQALPPREVGRDMSIIDRTENNDQNKSQLVLDVGNNGTPVHRLSFTIDQENFHRRVSLEGSTDAGTWSEVLGSGTIYSFNTKMFVGSKLAITFQESRFRYYRLTIFNEDNPAMSVDSANADGYQRKLIFPISSGETYSLYYGNQEARTPSYELENLLPYLVTENLPQAKLGVHTPNPSFLKPPEPVKPLTERAAWLLPSAVGLVSLLVGVFLANLVRQIRRRLPPPR